MKTLLLVIITTLFSIAGTVSILPHLTETKASTTQAQETEPAYKRIMKTSTIRCGYGIAEPWLYIDPNSKKVMGLAADVINAIAKKLSLKVEWTQEIGWGMIGLALNENRIDVGCSSLWITGSRARSVLFTDAYVYNPLYVYVRQDDAHFKALADINKPEARFTIIDGEISALLKSRYFPRATPVALVASATPSDAFIQVVTQKSDAVIADLSMVDAFHKNNDKKLRRIGNEPLVAYGAGYPVAKGEYSLKHMMDAALNELLMTGELQAIIKKYTDKHPKSFFPPTVNYQR